MGHLSAFVALLLFYTLNSSLLLDSQECTTGELRTVPEDNGRDYPQYCLNGEWRRMCAGSGIWTTKTATVACRQLGYSGLIAFGSVCPSTGSETDRRDGEVRLSASCNGTENRLKDCGDGVVEMTCSCEVRAYLECEPDNCDGKIRLVGGSTNREGRVEVCLDGRWGTVCNNNQKGIAEAVCSQLGFLRQDATTVNSFGPGVVPIRNCTALTGGNLNCSLITNRSCDHSMDLGVVCLTYEQLYNELLTQCFSKSESTPCPTCLPMTVTGSGSTTITAALGAVTGVLLVLLLGTVTALVVMCLKRRQALEPSNNVSSQNGDKASTDQSYVAVTDNPAYKAIERNQMDKSVYEVVDL